MCGRLKDLYFDDSSWGIKHLVISIEPRQFGQKQVLVLPDQVRISWDVDGVIQLNLESHDLESLPLASSVLPVCQQYAALAYASPGARSFRSGVMGADPHLQSSRAVTNYRLEIAGESGGSLSDFLVDDESWEIRYLGVEQRIDRKKLNFFVLPQSVERFTWATQRVLLRDLEPVVLEDGEISGANPLMTPTADAA